MKRFMKQQLLKVAVVTGVVTLVVLMVSTSLHQTEAPDRQNLTLKSWGANDFGQWGTGKVSYNGIDIHTPQIVLAQHVVSTYSGLRHSLALTSDGKVLAWGSNEYGQMGNGKIGSTQPTPTEVQNIPKMVMLATKQDHNLALDDQGHVWAWGLNMSGQLGDGTNNDNASPHMVKDLDNVKFISAGYRSSVVIKNDGRVWVWGGYCNLENRNKTDLIKKLSQLVLSGYNDDSAGSIDEITPEDNCIQEKYLNIHSYKPKKIEGLPPIKQLSAGFGHVLAIDEQGQLWAWGCNRYGQIGTGKVGSTDENLKPIHITSVGRVRMVSAGFRHSLAIAQDGQLWAWGHNYYGELGNSKTRSSDLVYPVPAKINGLRHMRFIAAGHDFSMAIGEDKKLYGWGDSAISQLSGDEEAGIRPRILNQFTSVQYVSAGGEHVIVSLAPRARQ